MIYVIFKAMYSQKLNIFKKKKDKDQTIERKLIGNRKDRDMKAKF